MVHHTISTKSNSAPNDSSNNNHMQSVQPLPPIKSQGRQALKIGLLVILGWLAGCAAPPPVTTQAPPPAVRPAPVPTPSADADMAQWLAWDAQLPLPPAREQAGSQWLPVHWRELPGIGQDDLDGVWQAWLRSCEQQRADFCRALQLQQLAEPAQRWQWLIAHWQPYAVQSAQGMRTGMLTGYFEPQLKLMRQRDATHTVPLYALPQGWRQGQTWYTRQAIDTQEAPQQALAGKAIAWAADPIEALVLQIQGSGRATITEPNGESRQVRLAFAGHNGQPYRSIGRWLLDQGEVSDGSWDGIQAWVQQNPERLQALLWVNPRVVFFREEALAPSNANSGPRGAQGVPLTPARSVAVDPRSVPYGTPLWLDTEGVALTGSRLVLAQDTGGAIVGAVRADFFTGWGQAAKDTAYRLKQPMRWWALAPREAPALPPQ